MGGLYAPAMPSTHDIVSTLWGLCHILRDDGITYHQYVTELTYLLFLKMAKETGVERQIPAGYRWDDLRALTGLNLLSDYRRLLLYLGEKASGRIQMIYADASTALRQPHHLQSLVTAIDAIDWFAIREEEAFGDMYEGLLQKNAAEKKSGAGQYFTPRPLIQAILKCVQPRAGETIQDPAAGTGGFLIAADQYIKAATHDLADLSEAEGNFQRDQAFTGVELVQDTHRLAMMNLLLHDIQGPFHLGDTLSDLGGNLPLADIILTNPPFGTKKGGGGTSRTFTHPTSNKQLAFLQHIYKGLNPRGRAAVVLPDNVLFEDNAGVLIRRHLMDTCNLHTILRLPTGIFYAQGVKTNVLFFQNGPTPMGSTKQVWVYDMRANMPSFGKRNELKEEDFADFVRCYHSHRVDQGETGRFRCFSRQEIANRGDNLDISWLRDDSTDRVEDLPEPDELADTILERLTTAMEEIGALKKALGGGV